MRNLQIGVIGSCKDLNYTKQTESLVERIGVLIAKKGYTLVYGAEKDCDSLPTLAALAAKNSDGRTIGVTYGRGRSVFNDDAATVVIATGLVRGGGRETTLMLSCDVVIAVAGGSGTLNEICVAYQANIPVITITGCGGWSEKLANTYLDERKRYKFASATTADEALLVAENLINENEL